MFQLVQIAPGEAFFNNHDSHFVGYEHLGSFTSLAAAVQAKQDLVEEGKERLAVLEQ